MASKNKREFRDADLLDEEAFWKIIASTNPKECRGAIQKTTLELALSLLTPREIVQFNARMDQLIHQAHKSDLWCAATILSNFFVSDDSFVYFRAWLISRGRDSYYGALKNPDSLIAEITPTQQWYDFETFLYASTNAYRKLTGKELYEDGIEYDFPYTQWHLPRLTLKWNTGDDRDLRKTCPKLFDHLDQIRRHVNSITWVAEGIYGMPPSIGYDEYMRNNMEVAEDILNKEARAFQNFGFALHSVMESINTPSCRHYYTVGLAEKYNHLDLQITFQLSEEAATKIMGGLIYKIAQGQTFEPDKPYLQLLNDNLPLRFIPALVDGRRVLRAIIPDQHGNADTTPYKEQLTQLHDGPLIHLINYTPAYINTIQDVFGFFNAAIKIEKLNFHPDNSFADYIDIKKNAPIFSKDEANRLDQVLSRCFKVCNETIDIYGIAHEILKEEMRVPARILPNQATRRENNRRKP